MISRLRILACLWLCVAAGVTSRCHAQSVDMLTIEGTVRDAAGKLPLPGVYVSVEKSLHGAVTDEYGRYILRIPKNAVPETKIKFSQLGMKPVEVKYNCRTRIDVAMDEDTQTLQEVVITGVYNLPRRDMVGAFTTIKIDSIYMLRWL